MATIIRPVTVRDHLAITEIYNHYIEQTTITFEEDPLTLEQMAQRIQSISSTYPYLVATDDRGLLGYAYAGPWKPRSAYRYTVETSIYLNPEARGKGVGKALYSALINQLMEQGFRLLIAGITVPNEASEAFHRFFNFRPVGSFTKAGYKFDQWLDVAYWERRLD